MIKYSVEAWVYPCEDGNTHECEMAREFTDEGEAKVWAWARMEEGFAVRLYLF